MSTVETGHRFLNDRYELQELIAVGGMGEVWRARDALLDRLVAVKLLRGETAGDPVFIARFRSEARHAAALSHPNIAAVLDYGETTAAGTGEKLAYLVMELVDGAPLSARLNAEGSLDTGTTLSVLRQAAAGLAEAHRAGVVHRDVKPANILVRHDGTVKLTDFGISWSAGSVPLTRTGQVIGTAQYMSPEQAMGEQVGPASDVYALGMVGYESLTGHTAFEGDNPVTVALKQVQERPEPLPAELPQDVRALIDAALVKDPEERLPDGEAFLTALEDTLARPSVTASLTRPVAVAARPQHRARPVVSPPVEQQPRRRGALLVLLPLLALLGLGLGAYVALGDSPPTDVARSAEVTSVPTASGIELAVDDYVGRPVEDVVADLTALGLTVRQEEEITSGSAPGTVVGLELTGTVLERGDEVLLRVAVAPADMVAPPPAVPSPVGTPEPVVEPVAPRAPEGDAGPATVEPPVDSPSAPPAEQTTGAGSDAPATPEDETATDDGTDTATPTTPTDDADPGTGTPTTPPEDEGSPTPTTPPEDEGSPTPTTPPEDEGSPTPTTPPEDEGSPTPTTPPEDEGSPTPTTPPEDEGSPTPTTPPEDEGSPTPTTPPDDEGSPTPTTPPDDGGTETGTGTGATPTADADPTTPASV
ncbi:serine/threonine-protein kinase [Blastococcus saxobsidens]|uniref:non-specific serine/threonine protein kinase n=1 Tax=Blastococcus saxobsidens (strain DD2) TaxID=1146883 RepID=H6RLK9_BLASD|nr:serine/threonine-protein kinase [Blastococcus saxobsidens]CCG03735.1 Serine/threonine protein kinase with PASTA sensor(S) [Blastococcus saxobsidens DD2]